MNDEFARVAVVGSSCAGKTTLARELSRRLHSPHIELDALYWGRNWTPTAEDELRASVDRATAEPGWVCDGNYSMVRDIVWARATAVVWLNLSFSLVFGRALRRSISRAYCKSPLFGGNRETFRKSFLSTDSILLWVLRTHRSRRVETSRDLADPRYAHLRIFEIRTARAADELLNRVDLAARG